MLTCLSSELPESACLTFETKEMKKEYNVNVFPAHGSIQFIYFKEFSLRFSCTHWKGVGNAYKAEANHCDSHGSDFSCKTFCNEYLISSEVKTVIPFMLLHYKIITNKIYFLPTTDNFLFYIMLFLS